METERFFVESAGFIKNLGEIGKAKSSHLVHLKLHCPDVGLTLSRCGPDRAFVETAAGRDWGLEAWWMSRTGVSRDEVTEVLAVDEPSAAAAWVKNYGGPRGTGVVQIPGIQRAGRCTARSIPTRRRSRRRELIPAAIAGRIQPMRYGTKLTPDAIQ